MTIQDSFERITSVRPPEGGTIKFTCEPMDAQGNAVTPTAFTWRHTTVDGNTEINDTARSYPVSLTPSTSIDLVLSGADLQVLANEHAAGDEIVWRQVTFEWTYDSTEGSGLTGKKVVEYPIRNVMAITTHA